MRDAQARPLLSLPGAQGHWLCGLQQAAALLRGHPQRLRAASPAIGPFIFSAVRRPLVSLVPTHEPCAWGVGSLHTCPTRPVPGPVVTAVLDSHQLQLWCPEGSATCTCAKSRYQARQYSFLPHETSPIPRRVFQTLPEEVRGQRSWKQLWLLRPTSWARLRVLWVWGALSNVPPPLWGETESPPSASVPMTGEGAEGQATQVTAGLSHAGLLHRRHLYRARLCPTCPQLAAPVPSCPHNPVPPLGARSSLPRPCPTLLAALGSQTILLAGLLLRWLPVTPPIRTSAPRGKAP